MAGACTRQGRDEKCIKNFAWKIEGKTPPVRSWHRWEGIKRRYSGNRAWGY
jgi:hypothetical protein